MTRHACSPSCLIAHTLLALLALPGCAGVGGKTAPLEMTGGNVEKAKLSYRVSTSAINASLAKAPAVAGEAARLVAYEAAAAALPAASPWPANATATVEIAYPHPDKKEGFALVKVRVEVQPAGQLAAQLEQASRIKRWWRSVKDELPGLKGSGWSQETWLMDLPQAELVAMMGQLRGSGYFETYSLPGGATIEVNLDGTKTNKRWNQSPLLDALVMRVRNEGRMVSSIKPPTRKAPPSAEESLATVASARDELLIERLPSVQ